MASRYSADLVSSIADSIRDGTLPPGSALPSIRTIAASVGLSPGTVALAMRELREQGLIISKQGRRSRVAERPATPSRLQPVMPSSVRDLSGVTGDPALMPDIGSAITPDLYISEFYDSRNIVPELAAVMQAGFEEDGLDAGHLTVTHGALDAIERIFQAWLRPGATVLVEDPGWPASISLLRTLGYRVLPVEIDQEGLLPNALRERLNQEKVEALLTVPRAQNPTGAAVSPERGQAIRNILDDYPGLLTVEDDHLSLIAGSDYVRSAPLTGRWAVIRSFSKILGSDLRVAVSATDAETAARVQGRQLIGPGWVSHFIQRIVARLLTDEVSKDRIARSSSVYIERREFTLTALADRGADAVGGSGVTVMLPVDDEAPVAARLAAMGWGVQSGELYRTDTKPFLRICTATLGPADALKLADAVSSVVNVGKRYGRLI